jgi:hypothetical protein
LSREAGDDARGRTVVVEGDEEIFLELLLLTAGLVLQSLALFGGIVRLGLKRHFESVCLDVNLSIGPNIPRSRS